jgi:hypothetical protein
LISSTDIFMHSSNPSRCRILDTIPYALGFGALATYEVLRRFPSLSRKMKLMVGLGTFTSASDLTLLTQWTHPCAQDIRYHFFNPPSGPEYVDPFTMHMRSCHPGMRKGVLSNALQPQPERVERNVNFPGDPESSLQSSDPACYTLSDEDEIDLGERLVKGSTSSSASSTRQKHN